MTEHKTEKTGVYRLDDGRFRVKVWLTDPDTQKRKKYVRTLQKGATITDAVAARGALKEDKRKALTHRAKSEPGPNAIETVGDYSVAWIERLSDALKPTTERLRRRVIARRIVDTRLGDIFIDRLRRDHIQAWLRTVEGMTKNNGEPYARATRRGWWRTVKLILADLCAEYRLDFEHLTRVRPPSAGPRGVREKRVLTPNALARFLREFRAERAGRALEVELLATTGMRVGELYGLKWDAVDLEGGVITIRRSATKGELSESTKTHTARTVPVFGLVLESLRAHWRDQMREQSGIATGLVFPSNAGTPRYASSIRKPLRLESEDMDWLELVVTPQVLRRTFNTCCENEHGGILTRSMMGHSREDMTEHYAEPGLDAKRAAIDGIFGAFSGVKDDPRSNTHCNTLPKRPEIAA